MSGRRPIAGRVAEAASRALQARSYVSPIDVLLGMGWLDQAHVDAWQQRHIPTLEDGMSVDPLRLAEALRVLHAWAERAQLRPVETPFVDKSVQRQPLRFSRAGNEAIEKAYRTQWVSPHLKASQRARLEEKISRPPDLVAIVPSKEWTCHRCGGTGDILTMEPPGPACLKCAGLGDLELLPAGDAGLTRRANAASPRKVAVVRWNARRKVYQRVGMLLEPSAIANARRDVSDGGE